MATSYPTALDTDAQFPKTGIVAGVTTGEVSQTMNAYGAVQAVEAKVGVGASTPPVANGRFLMSQGDGTTVWQAPRLFVVETAATAYTFGLGDAGYSIESTSASATTFTVPPTSAVAWPDGTLLEVTQMGAGVLTIAAGSGVTIRTSATLQLRARYSSARIRYKTANEWIASGDLA